jgi:hypothetical protein
MAGQVDDNVYLVLWERQRHLLHELHEPQRTWNIRVLAAGTRLFKWLACC